MREQGEAEYWVHALCFVLWISDSFREIINQTFHLFFAIFIDMLVNTLNYLLVFFSLKLELNTKSVNRILEKIINEIVIFDC